MNHCLVKPGPPLSRFVELLWFYQNDSQPHQKERLMPDGCASLVINLAEDAVRVYDPDDTRRMETMSGSSVAGPHTRSIAIDTEEQTHVVGVSFRPGGIVPFLGMPGDELQNVNVGLEALWGRAAGELRERVLLAASPRAKLRVLEQVLLERSARNPPGVPAVDYAVGRFLLEPSTTRIARTVEETGLSPRRFIELFRQQVGVAPKAFCRVRRFQKVLERIACGRPVRWSEIALDCGYFDQAHFIHDFRNFSGINPAKYLRDHPGFPGHHNHLPIL